MRVIKSAPERLQAALFPPLAIGSALDDPGRRFRRRRLCYGRVHSIVLPAADYCIARSSGGHNARSSVRCSIASECCSLISTNLCVARDSLMVT